MLLRLILAFVKILCIIRIVSRSDPVVWRNCTAKLSWVAWYILQYSVVYCIHLKPICKVRWYCKHFDEYVI